ncbi:MAG: class I SAM-dependent methyltransferase [Anaerolineales bacterium]|nr:class I SAM-dependent methyltransferase [Anaerolineales bacterium]
MYDQIVSLYAEIFPLNKEFMAFLPPYLGPAGSTVLDMGCGPGDYVDMLSRRGYRAVGIDSSREMIAFARQNRQGIFIPFAFEDVGDGRMEGSYDCIYSIGNSLSYLSSEKRPAFLAEIACIHEQGGQLIIQVINWDQYLHSGKKEFSVKQLTDGSTFHRWYEQISKFMVMFHTELRSGGDVLQAWSAPLYPIPSELFLEELVDTGYSISGVYGDYRKALFDPINSPTFIVTAGRSG